MDMLLWNLAVGVHLLHSTVVAVGGVAFGLLLRCTVGVVRSQCAVQSMRPLLGACLPLVDGLGLKWIDWNLVGGKLERISSFMRVCTRARNTVAALIWHTIGGKNLHKNGLKRLGLMEWKELGVFGAYFPIYSPF